MQRLIERGLGFVKKLEFLLFINFGYQRDALPRTPTATLARGELSVKLAVSTRVPIKHFGDVLSESLPRSGSKCN